MGLFNWTQYSQKALSFGNYRFFGKKTKMNEEIDLNVRDPNNINDHIKSTTFQDVLAEPDGTHSIDCVWKFSHKCFECWKSLLYKILTLCFGICIAAEWGCEFAYIAFYHIWYITPLLKMLEIECKTWQRLYGYCVTCCVTPCCEAFGTLFMAFKKE